MLHHQSTLPEGEPALSSVGESLAKTRITTLWQPGDLFHNLFRYPRRDDVPRVDRLAKVLERGILAPSEADPGEVVSDLRLVVTGTRIPYDSVVFLHRYSAISALYTMQHPGAFTVFLDRSLPVKSAEEMGDGWPKLCADEVYVEGRIPLEAITGLVFHPVDAPGILREFGPRIRSLGIPVYNPSGTLLWPNGKGTR